MQCCSCDFMVLLDRFL